MNDYPGVETTHSPAENFAPAGESPADPGQVGRHLANVLAVQQYLAEMLEIQLLEPQLIGEPAGAEIIRKTLDLLRRHIPVLGAALSARPEGSEELAKAVAENSDLFFIGLSKRRPHDLPAMLRNDFAVLGLAARHYAMLHASGLAANDRQIVRYAHSHQRELEYIMRKIVRRMPAFGQNNSGRNLPAIFGRAREDNRESSFLRRYAGSFAWQTS